MNFQAKMKPYFFNTVLYLVLINIPSIKNNSCNKNQIVAIYFVLTAYKSKPPKPPGLLDEKIIILPSNSPNCPN